MLQTYQTIRPNLGREVYIAPTASVIGKANLADDVSIWHSTVVRGDVNHIHIGERSNIQDNSTLHVSRPTNAQPHGYQLSIGADVTIGHNVVLHGCEIADQCLIGIGSIILDGAKIDKHVILAAGSLVPPNRHLPSGYLYMGSPAQPVRPLRQDEIDYFLTSAQHYVRLKNQYLLL